MRKIILLSILAFSSPVFSAEDTKFLWNGEYRSRGLFQENVLNNGRGGLDAFSHRLILNAEFEPNDRLDAVVSGILFQNWGDDVRGFAGIREESDLDSFRIFEAYGEWHLSTAFFLKFGRWALDFGNGSLVSKNMDDNLPYSLDGVMLGYDASNFEFRLGGLRVGDWPSSLGFTADPDSSAYFALINLKSWEPVFKFFQIYLFRQQKDAYSNASNGSSIAAESSNYFGVSAAGEYNKLFYTTDYITYSGEFTDTNNDIDGFMAHVKLGVKAREKNNLRLFLTYHFDTGNDGSTANTDESYRPLFYNHHQYGGTLDLLSWGNLSYFGLGVSLEKNKKNKFTLQALSFSRSSNDDGVRSIAFGGFGDSDAFINSDISGNTSNVTDKDLGLEVDFIYSRDFDSGVSLEFLAGAFFTGDYLKAYQRTKDVYGARLTLSMPF